MSGDLQEMNTRGRGTGSWPESVHKAPWQMSPPSPAQSPAAPVRPKAVKRAGPGSSGSQQNGWATQYPSSVTRDAMETQAGVTRGEGGCGGQGRGPAPTSRHVHARPQSPTRGPMGPGREHLLSPFPCLAASFRKKAACVRLSHCDTGGTSRPSPCWAVSPQQLHCPLSSACHPCTCCDLPWGPCFLSWHESLEDCGSPDIRAGSAQNAKLRLVQALGLGCRRAGGLEHEGVSDGPSLLEAGVGTNWRRTWGQW